MSESTIKQEIVNKLNEVETKIQSKGNLSNEDIEFLCLISLLEEESTSVKTN